MTAPRQISGTARRRAWHLVLVAAAVAVAGATPGCASHARGPGRVAAAVSGPAARAATADPSDDGDGDDDVDDDDEDGDPEAYDVTPDDAPCPGDMALVDGRVCVDVYEASLVEVMPDGSERPYPHYLPVDGHEVRAVSAPGVYPQAFISEVQADDACRASGKRLCSYDEWKVACRGPEDTAFPYGDARQTGTCNDHGRSAVAFVFGAEALAAAPAPRATHAKSRASASRAKARKGAKASKSSKGSKRHTKRRVKHARGSAHGHSPAKAGAKRGARGRASARPSDVAASVWTKLNDPRLGQVEGALARTGEHASCTNGWGLFDMVGNVHEWVAGDPRAEHGTFAGGYYLDTTINGDGCNYRTQAHAHDYHDYSTGFRCCAEPRGEDR